VDHVPGRRLLAAIAAWAVAGAAVYGVIVVLAKALPHRYAHAHAGDFEASFLLALYALLFAALWVAFGGARGLAGTLGFRYTSWIHLLLAPVFWAVTIVVGALLAVPFERWLGAPKSNAAPLVEAATDPYATAVIAFTVVLLAPMCEELLFRGAIFGWLRGHVPVAAAAVLSAALFAVAHRFPPALVLLFVAGLSMAIVYERTGSTLNTFVMHMTQNAVALVAVYSGVARG
jgi:CAAX protease family protein